MIDNSALTRYATELDELLADILNSDAEMGVSFFEVIDSVEDLYVQHEGARYLVGAGFGHRVRPTHVPSLSEDPVLHVLTLLAFEVADLPLTVRVAEIGDRLMRFKRLSEQLLSIVHNTTRFQHI